ncbi:MAG TPA: hypothetical protein VFS21_29990 [Roseiflexaceae bacterium]|nr:hypothetical protein [Roseiflexaceae bacterium]
MSPARKASAKRTAAKRTAAQTWLTGDTVRLAVWLVLLLLGLWAFHADALQRWARTGVGRVAGPARLVRALHTPPWPERRDRLLLLAAALVAGEGALAASRIVRASTRRPTLTHLRVRIPRPTSKGVQDTGAALLRAIHASLPAGGSAWATLTLHAQPDRPVQFGVTVGSTPAQHAQIVAAVEAAVTGVHPHTFVDAQPDPLAGVLTAEAAPLVRTFRLGLPGASEGTSASERIDTLGPLVVALACRPGVAATELQIALIPLPDRLRAGETEQFHATVRAVVVPADAGQPAPARQTLAGITAALQRHRFPVSEEENRRLVPETGGISLALGPALLLLGGLLWSAPLWLVQAASRLAPPLLLLMLVLACALWHLRSRARSQPHAPLLARAPRLHPPQLLACWPWWAGPLRLGAPALGQLYHLPTAGLGDRVAWLPFAIRPAPEVAFVPDDPAQARAWLPLGLGIRADGSRVLTGLPLQQARAGLAFAAPPGTGKTRQMSRLFQFALERALGVIAIDGKGDDPRGLVGVIRRLLPLEDEGRLVLLDPLDPWLPSLNPLLGLDLSDELGVDEALGQIEQIFARIDPEGWQSSPRMAGLLRKLVSLVLYAEPVPTIAHARQALDDPRYRVQLLPKCRERNSEVAAYWETVENGSEKLMDITVSALRARFDVLLDTRLMRSLFSLPILSFSFEDALATAQIVLAPVPEERLGARAGPIGMLDFQRLLRAAYRRPGSEHTRQSVLALLDEFDFLVRKGNPEDVARALTKVRSFGVVLVLAYQFLVQLGNFRDFILNIPNRLILRVDNPDATQYSKLYPELSEGDIRNQEDHLYIRTMNGATPVGPYSAVPLPWLPALELPAPPPAGDWRGVIPAGSPTPAFDRAVAQLVYGEHPDRAALVQRLAEAGGKQWEQVWTRWQAIAAAQRAYILAHPGCVPLPSLAELHTDPAWAGEVAEAASDAAKQAAVQREAQRLARQGWLSRLAVGVPPLLAEVLYARIRRPIAAAAPEGRRVGVRRGATSEPPAFATVDAPVSELADASELWPEWDDDAVF